MKTITVYNFEGFSISEGKTINPGSYAPMDFIQKHGFNALPQTAMEVSPVDLNQDGLYIPKEAKP